MTSESEIWKSHPDIVGIEVSTLGRVRTLDRVVSSEKRTQFVKGRVLKQNCHDSGYLYVGITTNGKRTTKLVHRLIAKTFISNPDRLADVNHKNCIRDDNRVSNLEWCSHEENIAYRGRCGHTAKNNAPKSPIYAIGLDTLEVLHFTSQHEASRVLGILHPNIIKVIKGKRKQTGGYWFVNDDENAADAIKRKLNDIKDVKKWK